MIIVESGWPQWKKVSIPKYSIRTGDYLVMWKNSPQVYNTLLDRHEAVAISDGASFERIVNSVSGFAYKRKLTPSNNLPFGLLRKNNIGEKIWKGEEKTSALINLHRFAIENKKDRELKAWRAQYALDNKNWELLKKIGIQTNDSILQFVAQKNLKKLAKIPKTNCGKLFHEKNLSKKILKKCNSPLLVQAYNWVANPTPKRAQNFSRKYSLAKVDQELVRLNYQNSLRKHVNAIPRKFRSSELSRYAKTRWYFKKNETRKATKMLKNIKHMTYPNKWWGLRLVYARELLKTNDGDDSYQIASNHGLVEGDKKYWEAQWTSGWVALRFNDEPEIAYGHFKKLYDYVKQPVTIARASYWLGMAAQASGNDDLALKWYKKASEYPLYFYGQLAIHKRRALDPLNSDGEIILPKDPEVKIADAHKVSDAMEVKIGYLLALLGDKKDASAVFKGYIKKADSAGKIALIMRLASEFKDYEMDSVVSRAAEGKNVFFIRRKFRIVKEVTDEENSALIHAIIKQESGFVPHALSRVGAVGYMQLMPDTAKSVAKNLGVRYNKAKLGRDVAYNVKLGSHYIKQMVDRFDGSKMLAIAAYNAGPHNSDRWIREFYDPRKEKDIDKVVDWIELITYSETRNYVQRIMENLIVYKYITTKT